MAHFRQNSAGFRSSKRSSSSNVKPSGRYERFGETIRYLTWEEWQQFLDAVDDYQHKLMLRTIYELGCRVGEFVRIRLEHVDFRRGRVFFPRENTKTHRRRVSHFPLAHLPQLRPVRLAFVRKLVLFPGKSALHFRSTLVCWAGAGRVSGEGWRDVALAC